jgi:hypothetical protein
VQVGWTEHPNGFLAAHYFLAVGKNFLEPGKSKNGNNF